MVVQGGREECREEGGAPRGALRRGAGLDDGEVTSRAGTISVSSACTPVYIYSQVY